MTRAPVERRARFKELHPRVPHDAEVYSIRNACTPHGCDLRALGVPRVALPAGGAAARQQRPQDGATITPNYKDADLSQIIQAVSEVTGKNFIIDPRVNAKVTMLSATPMSAGGILRGVPGGAAGLRLCRGARGQGHQDHSEYRRSAAALDRSAEQRQLDLGRDRHADHHA